MRSNEEQWKTFMAESDARGAAEFDAMTPEERVANIKACFQDLRVWVERDIRHICSSIPEMDRLEGNIGERITDLERTVLAHLEHLT